MALIPLFLFYSGLHPFIPVEKAWAFPRFFLIGVLTYFIPFLYIFIRTKSVSDIAYRFDPKSPRSNILFIVLIFVIGPMWASAFALAGQIGISTLPSVPSSIGGKVSTTWQGSKSCLKINFVTRYGSISACSPRHHGYSLAQLIPMPPNLKTGDSVILYGYSNAFVFVLSEVKAGPNDNKMN